MYQQSTNIKPASFENIPLIDGEFDSFELNYDLEAHLREAETATFYHDTFDSEE